MKRSMQELKRPYGAEDFRLVRAGRRGTYWVGADGKCVRLSSDESEPVVERSRGLIGFSVTWELFVVGLRRLAPRRPFASSLASVARGAHRLSTPVWLIALLSSGAVKR